MSAPSPTTKLMMGCLLALFAIPVGLFVGSVIWEHTRWNPPLPPPRPRYLSTSEQAVDPPAKSPVVAVQKPARHTPIAHYHSEWTTYDAAMAESKRTGKPVLIDFSADWCGPCQQLRSQVLEQSALALEIEDMVIPVSIVDRRQEQGFNPEETEHLQVEYAADAFPTLIVVSARTGLMTRTQGFGGPGSTVEWIRESARAVR
jgi:thiol-disulfide isomerase/thioredoxin